MLLKRPRSWIQATIITGLLSTIFPTTSHGQLPGTQPLASQDDLAALMVSGIGRDLDRRIDAVAAERNSSHEAFLKLEATAKSRANKSKLDRLAKILGTTDQRVEPSGFEIITNPWNPGALATAGGLKAFAIRFESIPGVFGEGILLEPAEAPKASVVVLPDVAHSPEQQAGLSPGLPLQARLGFALAERGCRVVCLYLLDRESRYSANPEIQRFTNLPHREFLYRGSYEMGRTPVGYEAQKTMAAIDNLKLKDGKLPIVVVGHGEGGRIALYTGALDSRVSATWVSGAFGPRERMWQEPIDRNLWGILMEHGDAQVADLYGERALLIEASQAPAWTGPTPSNRGNQAAPGSINPISPDDASKEFSRSGRSKLSGNMADLVIPADGQPGASGAFARLAKHLNITFSQTTSAAWTFHSALPDPTSRQKRQLSQMLDHVQKLWRASHRVRDAIWSAATRAGLDAWKDFTRNKRREFSTDVIGELPAPEIQPNPKSRAWKNGRNWKGHEVTLDLGPDVFAYGILLIPNDIKTGEKRPVVVCQHGLEGRPSDVCEPEKLTPYYNSFGATLADRGYIVFAPQNAYIGKADFRKLQRKANPIKLSLFSYIVRQHERIIDWLETLPMVDPNRIGFYGLSYGGKTAMRVPALVPRYALSVCSGDFNEWVGKNILTDLPGSYVFTFEHEMPEFDLGHTFNYAEMAFLIAPRPFMVERGHDDGVGTDEMVSWEFARVRRQYSRLKIPENTAITYFPGGHEVRGGPCFEFLDKHLNHKPTAIPLQR